jgi:hypothetical protein
MRTLIVIVTSLSLLAADKLWANGGENFPFQVGEKLTYQIFWGPFVAGRATLEVNAIEQIDGKDCYHLIAEARTSGLVDLLFHFENRTESWLDVNDLFTRRSRQRTVEGRRTKADDTHYDYVTGRSVTTNFMNGKSRIERLDGPVQDVISSVYYVRTQPLQLDSSTEFKVNTSGTNYTVNIRPDQRKTLRVRPVGEVAALRVEPRPTLNIVAANNGRVWFWISDDQRRLPLLVASDMKIGSARLVLSKVKTAGVNVDAPEPAAALQPSSTIAAR